MIKFKNVTKIFKTEILTQAFTALNDVTFTIPEGSMVGFLGANGAGKTTSLKIIMDFIRPTSGEVIFDKAIFGEDKMDVFKNIGFLPERPYFYPNLTGEEFLRYMSDLSSVDKAHLKREIKRWAPRFKIDYALGRELKTYSKGMLQRIGFLATIIHHPKLIILDEPLSGLDPIGRKELKDVIVEVHKEGKTVFFSSHIVPDIEEICDRVIFLKEGRLIYDGAVNTLLLGPIDKDVIITIQCLNEFNVKTPIKDKKQLPDQLIKIIVSSGNKEALILELIKLNMNILSLEVMKPSLEEIFYHTQRTI